MPFNVTLPWGESIAAYMNTSFEELNSNMPNDPNIVSMISSTCSLVRDYSIKELVNKNKYAAIVLKDLCYGSGRTMHENELIYTGICKKQLNKTAHEIVNVDGANDLHYNCMKRSGTNYVRVPLPEDHDSVIAREGKKEHLAEMSKDGGGEPIVAPTEPTFLQNSKKTKQENNPKYVNPELNGSGGTLNSDPIVKKGNNPKNELFKKEAYGEGNNGESLKGEENKTLGSVDIKETDDAMKVVKMEVPDYFCEVICAGLNIDETLFGSATIENPEEMETENANKAKEDDATQNDPINMMNNEELVLVNRGRYGVDPARAKPGKGLTTFNNKDYYGQFECELSMPDPKVCMDKGSELATWFSERMLNNEVMCDYEKGECGTEVKKGGAWFSMFA